VAALTSKDWAAITSSGSKQMDKFLKLNLKFMGVFS
jgi:hypothetical protein